jgi:hypothetical protein
MSANAMKKDRKISIESVLKKGRGRPKKSTLDKELDRKLTKILIQEVHAVFPQMSGKPATVTAVLAELDHCVRIEDSLWRKYKSGLDAMGPERMFHVASFAYIHGARGPAVHKILLSPRHGRNTKHVGELDAHELALKEMAGAINRWLLMVDPLEISHENFNESFNRIVRLAKDMAWQEYLNKHNEKLNNQEMDLEALGFYDDHDAFMALQENLARKHDDECKKDSFFIGEGSNIDGGAKRVVKKPKLVNNPRKLKPIK